jgi:hypothetical protein
MIRKQISGEYSIYSLLKNAKPVSEENHLSDPAFAKFSFALSISFLIV